MAKAKLNGGWTKQHVPAIALAAFAVSISSCPA